ncbi:MAG: PQQ-like beta-propeller repeat protein [Verrucomicrobia bacterium]|nr:PQQ-like beta-propeller repeat protein [Verrucomicrobiota bacterium]
MKRIASRLLSGPLGSIFSIWVVSAAAHDWPQWRGPDRTDVSKETGLLKQWPEGGPKRAWLYESAGAGYAGPSVVGAQLFTMGTRDESEILLALDANSGKELWAAKVGLVFAERRGDGPRSTPTVDGARVYAMGGRGDLICADVGDGRLLWRQSMRDLGGGTPNWGYTESVLVDGKHVICTPGGSRGAIAALDKTNGKLVWQSKEFTEAAHYASIIVAEPNGVRQYIQLTASYVAGVSAKDGKLLWKSAFPGRTAVIPTPIFHDGCAYVTAGYGAGSKLVKIGPDNQATDVYENKVMKNHHGGVVLVGEYLYGHSDGTGWLCQNFKTGEEVWSERRKLGKGAITCADGMLYCLDEADGTVALLEASPTGWQERGRFKLDPQTAIRSPQGRIWTHPVICNGRLYLRDQNLIYCYEIKGG